MGFRSGAYATVWDVSPKSEKVTQIRISTSKKPKGSDEYIQDFSGFCACIGENAAKAARALQVKDRIKLGEVEVCTTYVKEKEKTYTNFNIFSFEKAEQKTTDDVMNYVDPEISNVDEVDEEEGLPW